MKIRLNQVLLVVTSLLLGVIGCLYFMPSVANAQRAGPFMLVRHSNTTANVGIFRIDQSSGAVSFCAVDDRNLATHCGPAAE